VNDDLTLLHSLLVFGSLHVINDLTMKEIIGIVGAGITGLATAYVLSSKYTITIIARDLPGDLGTSWASPWYSSTPSLNYLKLTYYSEQELSSTLKLKRPSRSKICKGHASNSTGILLTRTPQVALRHTP
jgi:hypothetical protein